MEAADPHCPMSLDTCDSSTLRAIIARLLADNKGQQASNAKMQATIDGLLDEIRQLRTFIMEQQQNTGKPLQQQQPTNNKKQQPPKRPRKEDSPIPLSNPFDVLMDETHFPPPPPPLPTAPLQPHKQQKQKPTNPPNTSALSPSAPSPSPPSTSVPSTSAPSTSAPSTSAPSNPTPTTSPPSTSTTTKDTIPPIILHNKEHWFTVSSALNAQKSKFSRATNTREGIRITPSTIQDFRTINSFLAKGNYSFHSFQLPSEKTIKVVIRGVPQHITTEEVRADLSAQNYTTLHVTRLNGRNNRPAPLVQVQVERKFQSIFNLKTCCNLDITVEAKKIPPGPLQCHRCQRFGHSQPNCHAPYRCMKCADSHSTHLCPKPSTTPATCANCNSNHISTHHTCNQNPTNLKKSYSSALKPAPTTQTPATSTAQTPPVQKPQSFTKPTTQTPTTSSPSFATLSFPFFEALLASNPTPERIALFTNQLTLLKQTLTQ